MQFQFLRSIEWEAYDDHSGLDTVSWKLYDSFGTYVLHGHEDIVAQGHAVVSITLTTVFSSLVFLKVRNSA